MKVVLFLDWAGNYTEEEIEVPDDAIKGMTEEEILAYASNTYLCEWILDNVDAGVQFP
jgi:hypothetical protein